MPNFELQETAGPAPARPGIVVRLRQAWTGRRDYAINATSDALVTVFSFGSSVLIGRGLGPQGRGQLSAALLWPSTIGVVISLGLPQAFAYASGATWSSARKLARFAAFFALGVGLAAAVGYFVAAPAILHNSFEHVPSSLRWFALFIPLSAASTFWMALYQGRGDFTTWAAAKLMRSGGYTLWIAAALIAGIATVPLVLWSQVVLAVVLLAWLGARLGRIEVAQAPESIPTGKLFRYGASVYVSSIFYILNQQLDQLLLSLWVPPADLGQYATAVSLSAILLFLPSTLGPVIFSRLARSGGNGKSHAVRVSAACAVLLLPAGALMTLLAPFIVHVIYGAPFAIAGHVLRVMAPAAVLLGLGNLFSDILRGSGRPLIPTYAMLAGVAVTIPGLLLSLPRWGIWGAAWVSVASYAVMLAVQAGSYLLVRPAAAPSPEAQP